MASTKSAPTKGAPTKAKQTSLVDRLAASAKPSVGNDFLPIADFGDKLTPGKWAIEFLEDKPVEVEKVFDDGDPRLKVDARMARIVDGVAQGSEDVSIFLRIPADYDAEDPNAKLPSLPNGILSLYKETGGLKGVKASIRKRIYEHERFGKSTAYDVRAMHDE